MSLALVDTARRLARAAARRPRQTDLTRAVSTAYYAVFHAFARDAADLLVGGGNARSTRAWRQAYRSLEHGPAKLACQQLAALGFPPELVRAGAAFVMLQEQRHLADYDPLYRVNRSDAARLIDDAERAIMDLHAAEKGDRRAFAVLLLFKRR